MSKNGKYQIVRKIDSGGMAEVFQGIAEGIEGFTKKIAIKRVLPHLVENKKFLAMFLDEARLSLRLTHANVVHVFDLGKAGGTYFIVMEFVDGTNLKKIMEIMREKGGSLPVEQAIFIMMEVCRGLGYAHDLEDTDGTTIGIVHRDVSPPNILLSRQGEVKIVDFGLAKASSQLEHTDPGVVKGKFAYLSPEAAWGKTVDKRADIFSCGICLWELITGKRLFLGENDVQTVKLVRNGEVPPMVQYAQTVKPELERIVKKSLAQDVADRYQSCDDLAEDLAGYLFAERLKVTGFDIKRLISGVMELADKEEAPRPSIIDQLIQEEMGRFASLGEDDVDDRDSIAPNTGQGDEPLNPFGFEDPRNWASEVPGSGSDSPIPGGGASEWRESGVYRTGEHSLEPIEASTKPKGPGNSPVSLAQMLEGEVRMGSEAPLPEMGVGKSAWIGVVVALAIVAVGAGVAFAMGWIP